MYSKPKDELRDSLESKGIDVSSNEPMSEEELAKVRNSIEELNAALEAGAKQNQANFGSPVLQIEDLSEVAYKYLSASARYDQAQKAKNLVVRYDDGRAYKAIYFATRVAKGDEERAVEYLARILNDLSSRGLVHSTLAPISSLNLAQTTLVLQSVVFSFVLIPQESHDDVAKLYPKFVVQEGDVGHELYDLSPILSEGEFLATVRISCCPLYEPKDLRSIFQEELNKYLAVLPKGTRVRSVTQLAVTDLSIGFEVKFHNELLQGVKRVEIDYERKVAKIGNGIKSFNLLTGIKYSYSDGIQVSK